VQVDDASIKNVTLTISSGYDLDDTNYDSERQLWYSVIEITPKSGSYTPFVKLALGRWQSSAVNETTPTDASPGWRPPRSRSSHRPE
jgi:hypothetical protein